MQYTAQYFYPMMQAFDPFYFNADILQLGMDQRKVMVLSRELAPKLGREPPVVLAHHLMMGLEGAGRMGNEITTWKGETTIKEGLKLTGPMVKSTKAGYKTETPGYI